MSWIDLESEIAEEFDFLQTELDVGQAVAGGLSVRRRDQRTRRKTDFAPVDWRRRLDKSNEVKRRVYWERKTYVLTGHCKVCGTMFFQNNSRGRKKEYCSNRCLKRFHKQSPIPRCELCGRELPKSRQPQYQRRTCSHSCRTKLWALKRAA